MHNDGRGRRFRFWPLLWAVAAHGAAAQVPAPSAADGQPPTTVLITAHRPANIDGFKATMDRIKAHLVRPPGFQSRYLSYCLRNQLAEEMAAMPGTGRLPGALNQRALDRKRACTQAHLEATDLTLKQGLQAFEQRDYAAALALFRQAYEKLGNQDAAVMLAKMHADGLGTPKDKAAAIKWLDEVAGGKFDPRWETMRFHAERPQAMNARIEAALMLGRIHEFGDGVPVDARQAMKWYGKAVEFGFVPALDSLGLVYLSGPADVRDPARAVRCFKDAVEAGFVPSAYHLGKLYHDGADGVARDPLQAGAYFEFAAKAGDADALLAAGRMFERGETVAPNATKAAAYYTEAAAKGNADAQRALDGLAQGQQAAAEAQAAVMRAPTVADAAQGSPAPEPGATPQVPVPQPMPAAQQVTRYDQDDAGAIVVRVTGLRAVPWKSYRALRAAVAAFERYHLLAPDAVLRFGALPPPGKTLPANFSLRVLTRDGKEYPITLENKEIFQLPLLPDPDVEADLVSNMPGAPLRIGLLVHSTSVPLDKERLGDVRLRNEISEAIAKVDHPDIDPRCQRKRTVGCRGARATVWFRPRAPAASAWVVDGDVREALQTDGNANYPRFKMPINAGHLSHDAIIEFDFLGPPGPVKYSSVAIYEPNDG